MGLFRKKADSDFKALSRERRELEDDQPWFAADDDGPALEVETGIGSNLRPGEPTPPGTD